MMNTLKDKIKNPKPLMKSPHTLTYILILRQNFMILILTKVSTNSIEYMLLLNSLKLPRIQPKNILA